MNWCPVKKTGTRLPASTTVEMSENKRLVLPVTKTPPLSGEKVAWWLFVNIVTARQPSFPIIHLDSDSKLPPALIANGVVLNGDGDGRRGCAGRQGDEHGDHDEGDAANYHRHL